MINRRESVFPGSPRTLSAPMAEPSPQSDGRDGVDRALDDATVAPDPAELARDAVRVTPSPRSEAASLPQTLPQTPPVAVPNHTLVRCLGVGGFGQVWLGKHLLTEHYRACKIIPADRARELHGLKRIKRDVSAHPGLVPIEEVGVAGDWLYCLMPLADSARTSHAILDADRYVPSTLQLHLKRQGGLAADDATAIARELAEAIVHLHRHGVTHGDIKPANVLRLNGRWALADYGLADDVDAATGVGGTPGYLPPEGPGSPKADQYALGVVMQEMIARDSSSPTGRGLLGVATRATAVRPDDRFASVVELAAALAALPAGESTKRRDEPSITTIPESSPVASTVGAAQAIRHAVLDFWVAIRHGGEAPRTWRRSDPTPTDATGTAMPVDPESIACANCGYALRGLGADGRCPECALSVAESMRAAGLWTARRLKLLLLACAGLIAMLPAWLVVAILPLAILIPTMFARMLVAASILVYAVLLIVIAVATVHAASKRGRSIRYGLVATVCIIGALPVLMVVSQIINPWFVNDLMGSVIFAVTFLSRVALFAITLLGLRAAAVVLRAPGTHGWSIAAALTLLAAPPWAYLTLAPAMMQDPLGQASWIGGLMLIESAVHAFAIALAIPLMIAARRQLRAMGTPALDAPT